MSSAFRRLSKSSAGTLIMAFILVLILVGFAMGDIQSIVRGGGISGSADTMAKVGSDTVSDRDVTRAMERRLSQVREQKPDADYPAIAGDDSTRARVVNDHASLPANVKPWTILSRPPTTTFVVVTAADE